ncbi:MAG: lasso peptide [Cyanobacteria bacterium P01_A01_bin.84]
MKSIYTTPELKSLGNVAEMTKVVGNPTREDFVFLNGAVVSNSNDIDSMDLNCKGTFDDLNCKAK